MHKFYFEMQQVENGIFLEFFLVELFRTESFD